MKTSNSELASQPETPTIDQNEPQFDLPLRLSATEQLRHMLSLAVRWICSVRVWRLVLEPWSPPSLRKYKFYSASNKVKSLKLLFNRLAAILKLFSAFLHLWATQGENFWSSHQPCGDIGVRHRRKAEMETGAGLHLCTILGRLFGCPGTVCHLFWGNRSFGWGK